MYFHYPSWPGSMPDPSMVAPPPVVFKAYYFKSGKAASAKRNGSFRMGPFADDDSGVDYAFEYVRPTPHPPPPIPPDPPKKEDTFEYWTHTRVFNAQPQPFAFPSVPPIPPFHRPRPFGFPSYSHEYRYTQTHPRPHPQPQPQDDSQPRTKVPPANSKPPRTTWSTPESTKAWRARQRKLWEEWEKRSREARQARDDAGWEGWTPRGSTGTRSEESKGGWREGWGPRNPNSRPQGSQGGWREGWAPPRAPSPAKSDGDWRDRAWYTKGHNHNRAGQYEADEADEQWSQGYWPPPRPEPLRHFDTNTSTEKKLSEAFALYCKAWETLLSSTDSASLTFQKIPWPQYPAPRCVEDINTPNVQAFLKAGGRPLKNCLREALLRFHPDKTALLLTHVAEKDKADVAAGCEAVTRCLSQLMNNADP